MTTKNNLGQSPRVRLIVAEPDEAAVREVFDAAGVACFDDRAEMVPPALAGIAGLYFEFEGIGAESGPYSGPIIALSHRGVPAVGVYDWAGEVFAFATVQNGAGSMVRIRADLDGWPWVRMDYAREPLDAWDFSDFFDGFEAAVEAMQARNGAAAGDK